MCQPKTYKRFLKLYNSINSSSVFNTKLGPRCVKVDFIKSSKCFNTEFTKEQIWVIYYDFDNTELFNICIEKSGRITIINSRIDEHAIFAAIYEIECMVNNKKQKRRDIILEKLFENIDEFNFYNEIFGLTQYR